MQWVELDVKEQVIGFVNLYKQKTSLPVNWSIGRLGIISIKYYSWIVRQGKLNKHNGSLYRNHWIVDWERDAIN